MSLVAGDLDWSWCLLASVSLYVQWGSECPLTSAYELLGSLMEPKGTGRSWTMGKAGDAHGMEGAHAWPSQAVLLFL